MRAGPKQAVDGSVLPFRARSRGSTRFAAFCDKFIKVRESKRVVPLRMRPWQRELVGTVLDADPQPRVAGWCLPRGQEIDA